MTTIHLIWAQSRDGVIGDGDALPWHVPEDLVHFKAATIGHPVCMGRRTWLSLPPATRPLPGRRNIVLSHREAGEWSKGAEVISTVDQLNSIGTTELWGIGGATVYEQLIDKAATLVVTDIDADYAALLAGRAVYAPTIPTVFRLVDDSGWQESITGTRYRFRQYTRDKTTIQPE